MTLVVVGASLAGLRAVESARRTGYRGRIVLIGAEGHLPYDRPGVYAAGDVARVANPLFDGEPMRPEHWTNAAEQGAAAARHALDPASARALEAVPYFCSDWYGHRLPFVGTPRADEVVSAGGTTLHRRGDRIVGALTVDRPREIMKYRRRVAWAAAPAFAGAA